MGQGGCGRGFLLSLGRWWDVSEQGNCSGDLKEDRLSAWTRGLVMVVDRVRLVEGLAANAQDSKEAGGRS